MYVTVLSLFEMFIITNLDYLILEILFQYSFLK